MGSKINYNTEEELILITHVNLSLPCRLSDSSGSDIDGIGTDVSNPETPVTPPLTFTRPHIINLHLRPWPRPHPSPPRITSKEY
ncbi:hypothetical protein J6590_030050, partial [Homalodisca vitripennis]